MKKPTLIVPPQGDILEVMWKAASLIGDASIIRKMKEQVMETTCYGSALKVINMYVDIRFSDGSTDGLEESPEEAAILDKVWDEIGLEKSDLFSMTEPAREQAPGITISPEIVEQIERAIEVAIAYEKITNGKRKISITGEVGEVLVCKELSLSLATDFLSAGFDAFDTQGKKVQIKTRRESRGKPQRDNARIGRFSEHQFDYGILAILDSDYRLKEIWKADYDQIMSIVANAPRRNPSLYLYKRVAEKVYG